VVETPPALMRPRNTFRALGSADCPPGQYATEASISGVLEVEAFVTYRPQWRRPPQSQLRSTAEKKPAMSEHLIVTMFQVFLVLLAIVVCVAAAAAVRAVWGRWLHRVLTRSACSRGGKKLCAEGQQPPSGA
jgi:hypothetical protein